MVLTFLPTSTFAKNLEKDDSVVKEQVSVLDDGYTLKVTESIREIKTEMFDAKGNFIDSTIVDKQSGEVKFTQKDGSVSVSNVNDYIEDVSVVIPQDVDPLVIEGDPVIQGLQKETSIISPQALISEPMTDAGLQNSTYGDGYKYLGSASVNYSKEVGYLYRQIGSMKKGKSHQFTFSAGTAVSTVVGIILGVFSGGSLTPVIITGLLATSGGVLTDYFRGTFDYRTYNYLYKVRVRMDPWFTTYRNIDYWVSYNDATETLRFKQQSFNHGFSQSNLNMVKAGIDNYLK